MNAPSRSKLTASAKAALSVLVSISLVACGGGGSPAPSGPEANAGPAAADPEKVVTTAFDSATVTEDIERLRGLGYEVVPVTGEADPEDTEDAEPALSEVDPPAAPSPAASSASVEAGRAHILSAGVARPLVVGGSYAKAGEFPWAVQVRTATTLCTGDLIGPSWVKTAKHCTPTANASGSLGVSVYIGSNQNGWYVYNIPVDYYVKLPTDVALFHLSTPTTVTPVAYNGNLQTDLQGSIISLGFGRTSPTGPVSDLKFVESTSIVPYLNSTSPGYMIFGDVGSNQTTCFGDSGGPSIRMTPEGYPLDFATTSATFYPYCTGQALMASTAYIATQIEQVTGIPPFAFPLSNLPPVIQLIGPQETALGATSIAIAASDPEGQPLVFTATGLPDGLTIATKTGVISGTTTAYSFNSPSQVQLTVTDSVTGAKRSMSFPWRVNTPGNSDPFILGFNSFRITVAGQADSFPITATDPNGDAVQFLATGLPPGVTLSPSGVFSGVPTLGGQYQVSVRAVDLKGGMASAFFIWNIANSAPVLEAIPDKQTAVGAPVAFNCSASDPEGNPVTFSAIGLPAGLKLAAPGASSSPCTVSGTTTAPGVYLVKITASDPYGGVASKTFTWAVNSSFNRPPTMTQLSDITSPPGLTLFVPIVATDPDGQKLTVSFAGLPSGVVYNGTLKGLSGTPTKGGVFTVNYSVYDAFGGKTTYPPITWTIPNTAPQITPPAAQTLQPGAVVNIPIQASDPDGNVFSITATGLPRGLVVNSVARTITGTVLQSGTFAPVLTATDKYGGKTVAPSFPLVVPNQAPVVATQLTSRTSVAGTLQSVPLAVSDPENHPLTITATGLTVVATASSLPPGLQINSTTKVISGRPIRPGTYTVTLVVADRYGAKTAMDPFTWTITNQAPSLPTFTLPGGFLSTAYRATLPPAIDPDGNTLRYSAMNLPIGLRMDAAGVITGTPTAAGLWTISFYATDPYGGKSEVRTVSITVAASPG